jgi:hypothetical protein
MNGTIACLIACALASTALPTIAAAQDTTAHTNGTYKAPRNAYGQPDFTGTWSNTTMTRMERAASYNGRLVLTPQEVAALEGERAKAKVDGAKPTAQNATITDLVKKCDIPGVPNGGPDCGVNLAWIDAGERVARVNGEPRTSLITFPADGRIPYKPGKDPRGSFWGAGHADNPEDRGLADRCIIGENVTSGSVMSPSLYNNTYVIQQGKDAAVIVLEMSHEPRIVRLNAKHSNTPKWYGDSIGHYEGDTLVVETTNFHPEQLTRNSPQLKMTERFTRTGKDRLLYQFKVEDPETYSQAWGGEYEFHPSDGPQYEYACHEGNYGLKDILEGARADEKAGKPRETASATPAAE